MPKIMIEWLKITLMSAGWLSVGSQGLPELVTAIRPPFAPLGGLTMLTLVLCYPILKTYRTSRQGFSYTNESSLFAKALLVCTIFVFALDFLAHAGNLQKSLSESAKTFILFGSFLLVGSSLVSLTTIAGEIFIGKVPPSSF